MANEKRLIDANAIHYCNYDLDNYHSFRAVDEDEIAEMPTIDAVEVVRCKDCIFASLNTSNGTFKCTTHNGMNRTVEAWEFCSYGERTEDGK